MKKNNKRIKRHWKKREFFNLEKLFSHNATDNELLNEKIFIGTFF